MSNSNNSNLFRTLGAEDTPGRPIPAVRVVPTRRAYIRRIKPEGSRRQPPGTLNEEYNLRSNPQNFPVNGVDPVFSPSRGSFQNRNAPLQDVNNFGLVRGAQYFSPNRQNFPSDYLDFSPLRASPNYGLTRTNRQPETFFPPRDSANSPANEVNRDSEAPEFSHNARRQMATTNSPKRLIRLRRPTGQQQNKPSKELLNRKPIINALTGEEREPTSGRGPVNSASSEFVRNQNVEKGNEAHHIMHDAFDDGVTAPLTYYTTFTYMTTFLNGPSTAFSTREAVVSNIATETLNPEIVGLIRNRGGFTSNTGVPSAVPLGSRAQGATTTIVNLASRVQLYNSDVYYGRSMVPADSARTPSKESLSTVHITDIAALPKTYYTLFTYYYTLRDSDKVTNSQRSETITNVDSQTRPFLAQDFSNTVDSRGFLTLSPDKKFVNLGLRTARGTTTEVNLELKTIVQFDNVRNAVVDRDGFTPAVVEVLPSETDAVLNNYLEPDDAEVQDQQTYPQTVAIQPSFSSSSVESRSQGAAVSSEATPEMPRVNRIIRTQSIRGPLRVATSVLQSPRSGVFVPRPGVRVRVKPLTSEAAEESNTVTDPSRDNADEEKVSDDEMEDGDRDPPYGRKKLKITLRRSTSATRSRAVRPTRTRSGFYVVTRTASPEGGSRVSKRPVSVKVSRRPRPGSSTSVPVVFGLSTTYRNNPPSTTEEMSVQPSQTVIFTYFTTTTYTVPYTIDGEVTYTTLEETNSRFVTETLSQDADLPFMPTTASTNAKSPSSPDSQTLRPQLVNNQLSLGPRLNLVTKVSNGVSLIVASESQPSPALTLLPTIVTDTLLMVHKDKTTFYEPRTVYTTFTYFTTFFDDGTPSTSTSEQVVTNVYSVPVTANLKTSEEEPITLTETSTSLVSTTYYTTHTLYATLFNGSETVVTPLEEIHSSVASSAETYTLTRTISPDELLPSTTTTSVYRTVTNFVTLFRGSESIVSPLEETETDVVTLTLDNKGMPSLTQEIYITKTIQATNTHYITLFSGTDSILSSITEVAPSVITQLVKQVQPAPTQQHSSTSEILIKEEAPKPVSVEPSYQDLVPSIRTQYTTLTYFTTLFTDSSTVLSSREEIATSYITLFVPASQTVSETKDITQPSNPSFESTFAAKPSVKASSEVLTFYTTYTYYTTLFRGTETIISDSETVVTQYVTIESTPTESFDQTSTSAPAQATSENTIEVKTENQEGKTSAPADSNKSSLAFDEEFKIVAVETKVQSDEETPSFITGVPSTDTDGATHILFTDFIVPSAASDPRLVTKTELPDSSVNKSHFTPTKPLSHPRETSTLSSARNSASDLATTRLTDVATHHMALHPTVSHVAGGASQTLGIKPGAVIDLSDVLTNTNLVGNLGETIKDIVNLFAVNGMQRNNLTKPTDSSIVPPVGGVTVSSVEEPLYIPIGAIGRNTITPSSTTTLLTGFTPILKDESMNSIESEENKVVESVTDAKMNTVDRKTPATLSGGDGRFLGSTKSTSLQSSSSSNDQYTKATPGIEGDDGTSFITGLETIFLSFPDARQPSVETRNIQGSISTSSIVGIETIFFDSPQDFFARDLNKSSSEPASEVSTTKESGISGETTVFFPLPGENPQLSYLGTRYVTSVESVTLTLTLTTSSVYQTEGAPTTVTSVFTTTIPPRTFVSTIIGSRTILGTQPEPTETLQVIPTMQPSESTTTVTTTTLIFNSIATTVVRTLVIPTHGVQPTRPATVASTESPRLAGVLTANQRPKVPAERPPTSRKPIQLFKSGQRPTDATTAKPSHTGPPLKLFPTKPPTTTTNKPPPTTTKRTSFKKPSKTPTPVTDGCPTDCNLKNKEICKQNADKSWSCQCRPGFFMKPGSSECKDVKSYVVLVRVLKMGGNDVKYQPELENYLSDEYKNLTTTARKAVDDAYKLSSVGEDYVRANVLSIHPEEEERQGVLVNLTVQLSGEKPTNEEFLKEELAHSLESAASDIILSNVSPIVQNVEDVQDLDECASVASNDCSRSGVCVNLPGSYTCQCKEGYQDLEPLLPGRICSGEIKDCDYCNNRGVCIMTEDDSKFCRCYRMYLGKQCEINGLVLAIALPIALALLILTMFCLLCGCRRLRQKRAQKPKQPFKGPPMAGTLDRKAMILDSGSESSGDHRHPAYDNFGESTMRGGGIEHHPHYPEVPTVHIPRARHSHPKQVNHNYRLPPEPDRW